MSQRDDEVVLEANHLACSDLVELAEKMDLEVIVEDAAYKEDAVDWEDITLTPSSNRENTVEVADPDFARYIRLSQEGRQPLAIIMNLMVAHRTSRALWVICENHNWQKVAFALAAVFHTGDPAPLRTRIARGYDRLRNLVITCVTNLREENRKIPGLHGAYARLVSKLFTRHNYPAP